MSATPRRIPAEAVLTPPRALSAVEGETLACTLVAPSLNPPPVAPPLCTLLADGRVRVRHARRTPAVTLTAQVAFTAPLTGRYAATLTLHGRPLGEAVEVLVAPPSVAAQRITLGADFAVGSGGFDVAVQPLTDAAGDAFYYEARDVHCDVVGGPEDPAFESKSAVRKNPDGTLTLTLAPRLPGDYEAQLFVYAQPVFEETLRWRVVADEGTPALGDESGVASNPIAGRQNLISLEGVLDMDGTPLTKHANPQSLVMRAVGDDGTVGFTGRGVVMRTGLVAVTFFAPTEGFFQVTIYDHDAPVTAPFEMYVGTSELRQQTAAGGQAVRISLDGAQVALLPLTDHAGIPVPYSTDDVRVDIVSTDGQVTAGTADMREDGALILYLTPPAPGSYVAQAYLGERPILARVLPFTVD